MAAWIDFWLAGWGGTAVSDADAGALGESSSIGLADADAGAVAATVAIAVVDTDAASFVESTFIAFSTADSGSFAESAVVALSTTDSAAASEVSSIALTATDSATLSESPSLALTGLDAGSGTDTSAIALSDSDSGTLSETQVFTLSDSDTARGLGGHGVSRLLSVPFGSFFGGTGTSFNHQSIAASFVGAGLLDSVLVRVRKHNSPTDSFYVDITQGSLTGPVVATSPTVSAATLTSSYTDTWLYFSGPVDLTVGATYYLRFWRTGTLSDTDSYEPAPEGKTTGSPSFDSLNTGGWTNSSGNTIFFGFPESAALVASLTDAHAASVTERPFIGVSVTDAASSTEASAIALSGSDAAAVSESQSIALSASDAASTGDIASSTAQLTDTDFYTFLDGPPEVVTLSGADTLSAIETQSIALTEPDGFTSLESVAIGLAATDSATTTETVGSTALSATDDGAVTETVAPVRLSASDVGSVDELASLAFNDVDGSDALETSFIALSDLDVVSADDSDVHVALALVDSDSSTGVDVQALPIRTVTDSATVLELVLVVTVLAANDGGQLHEAPPIQNETEFGRWTNGLFDDRGVIVFARGDHLLLADGHFVEFAQRPIVESFATLVSDIDGAALSEDTAVALAASDDGACTEDGQPALVVLSSEITMLAEGESIVAVVTTADPRISGDQVLIAADTVATDVLVETELSHVHVDIVHLQLASLHSKAVKPLLRFRTFKPNI